MTEAEKYPPFDDPSWEAKAAPLAGYLAEPRTLDDIARWAKFHHVDASLCEQLLAWLRVTRRVTKQEEGGFGEKVMFKAIAVEKTAVAPPARTRVEEIKQRAAVASAPARPPAPLPRDRPLRCRNHRKAPTTPITTRVAAKLAEGRAPDRREEKPMEAGWVSIKEAAALMGITGAGVRMNVKAGRLVARKIAGDGVQLEKRGVVELAALRKANGGVLPRQKAGSTAAASPPPPRPAPAMSRALVPRAKAGMVARAQSIQALEEERRRLRWIVEGADIGALTTDEAISRIREILVEQPE